MSVFGNECKKHKLKCNREGKRHIIMKSTMYSNSPALKNGQIIRTSDGMQYCILDYLGRGGQGGVYRVRGADGDFALKWYHSDFLKIINSKAFYNNIARNVENGAPRLVSSGDAATQFIWPEKLVEWQLGSFGYLMRLFDPRYDSFSDVIMCRHKEKDGSEKPLFWKSWFIRITAALNIVRAFEILHAVGLSYQDLNEGGFAINMSNGDIMICDCDNVSPDQTNLGIKGVMNYMAPEVARCEKLPDHYTDQYSLAIILFRLFFNNHPMEGVESISLHSDEHLSRQEADLSIYGTNPHYCLSTKFRINPPDKRSHADVIRLSKVYPIVLLNAFEQVFTKGVTDPMARLTATEWRKILLQVRDCLVQVNGREEFYYTTTPKRLPAECRILRYENGRKVLCMPNKVLYAYHLNEYGTDFKTPVAKIIPTKRPDIIGMYNGIGKTIEAYLNGSQRFCNHGDRIPLLPGMTIKFGTTIITVE